MNLVISGHQLDLTEAIKLYVLEKLERAQRLYGDAVTFTRIFLSGPAKNGKGFRGANQKIAVELSLPRKHLFVSHSHEDLYAAIDLLFDRICRELREYKQRKHLAYQRRDKRRKREYHDS